MDDIDYEIVTLLQKLNVSKPSSKALACLFLTGKATSYEVEKITHLRQPEVSIAMNCLKDSNWVEVEEVKKKQGKGRPIKKYTLIAPVNEIIDTFEKRILDDNQTMLDSLEKLKRFS
ncbi:transcriptional regulator [Methanococcoides alaskense]|uniref:Transcriptional regulator n=1 Tax=Methanococcoides alaskense TaxID=325778 RepID=A0AA90U1E9_9EURY|nr:transcriptional regulator [Methanococcoides alaskense]MDA0525604.1 transcriptional regulator [Methanococcoides alaskense]MDR6223524.1 putative transcriptional regulator [Methanococcoides alaskense]